MERGWKKSVERVNKRAKHGKLDVVRSNLLVSATVKYGMGNTHWECSKPRPGAVFCSSNTLKTALSLRFA